MATLTVKVCDVCSRQDRETTQYTVEGGGRRATIDLCSEDAAHLVELLDSFALKRKRTAATGPRETGKFREYVGTMEDVEAAKSK